MLFTLLCIFLLPFQVYSCSPTDSSSRNGKTDELTLNISDVTAIPVDFVVYRGSDFPLISAPKSEGDARTNIKKSLQPALSEVFRANYDPSFKAGEALFDVPTITYKPLVCDVIALQNTALAGTVATSAQTKAGNVCLVSSSYRTVLRVCKYAAGATPNAATSCNTTPASTLYVEPDQEFLNFGEAVKVSFDDDTSGTRVQQLRSVFPKYKYALENSMKSYLNMFCSGAFRNSKVKMSF